MKANRPSYAALILSLALLGATPGPAATLSFLQNPSFEHYDAGWTRTAPRRGWTYFINGGHTGSHRIAAPGSETAHLSQDFPSILGANIVELSFYSAIYRSNDATLSVTFQYLSGPSPPSDLTDRIGDDWTRVDLTPLVDPDLKLTGIALTRSGSGTVELDSFTATAIPEPTAAFPLIGSISFLLFRRSRCHRNARSLSAPKPRSDAKPRRRDSSDPPPREKPPR